MGAQARRQHPGGDLEELERSPVLACTVVTAWRRRMLCMSAKAFGSDWAQLDAGRFQFREPLKSKGG